MLPCWHCNALLLYLLLPLPPPLLSSSVSSILRSTILCLYCSLPHPFSPSFSLPPSVFLPPVPTSPSPRLCNPPLIPPLSLCSVNLLQSDTAPYLPNAALFFSLLSLSANLSHSLSSSLHFTSLTTSVTLISCSHLELSVLTLSFLPFLRPLLLFHWQHCCSLVFTFFFSSIYLSISLLNVCSSFSQMCILTISE